MFNTFRAHAGQFMKIAAIACALCLAMAALAAARVPILSRKKRPLR